MTVALISIGSNQNNPQFQIETALSKIQKQYGNASMSSVYWTEPVGGIPQDAFLNAAIHLETQGSARELLNDLMEIERQAQRDRTSETPNGPRNLDLDIILFGDEVISESDLEIPHPRFRSRRFVLEPMNEIAATFIDPVTQNSISDLLEKCNDTNWVKPMVEDVLTS